MSANLQPQPSHQADPQLQPVEQMEEPVEENPVAKEGSWLFWIAGLTLINLLLGFFTGSGFAVSLSSTYYLDHLFLYPEDAGLIEKGIALGASITLIGLFAGLGFFAVRGHVWAFMVGIILFAMDGLVDIAAGLMWGVWEPITIVFHLLVLFWMGKGLLAAIQDSMSGDKDKYPRRIQ